MPLVNPGDTTVQDGFFRGMIRFRAEADQEPANFLCTSPSNALCTINIVQTDILNVIGDMMPRDLVEWVNKYVFSIIADESSDLSKTEHISRSVRNLDDGAAREDFLTIVDVMDEAHGEAQNRALEETWHHESQHINIKLASSKSTY